MNRSSKTLAFAIALALSSVACKKKADRKPTEEEVPRKSSDQIEISVIGTNDVHGHLGRLAVFGGYLKNLRAAREGRVVVLDGGDMFQGTLESNPNEGAAIVEAYNALGYTAVTIGNHEFDFGPIGPKAIPETGDDPQGALKARAKEATFPFLTANVVAKNGESPAWDNVAPSALIEIDGVKVGLIGVTTIDTPRTTISTNIANLDVIDPAGAIEREATSLRSRGAAAVLVTAHAGSSCKDFHDPNKLESCSDGEIFAVARRLPTGLVDVIVAGHTHAGVAHRVNGIAIIEAYSKGRAFGRVDMLFRAGVLKKTVIFPPRDICSASAKSGEPCVPGNYEGAAVEPDLEVAKVVTAAETAAAEERARPLGVVAEGKIRRSYREESALGNLFVDLMLEARPSADVAVTNGGGLRADIPKGPVTYGAVFQAMPFDNRFAFVTLPASKLAELFARNLDSKSGILSVAGVEVRATCSGSKLKISLYRDGRRVADKTILKVATSDFLAAGGDGAFSALGLEPSAFVSEGKDTIRDAMASVLSRPRKPLVAANHFDAKKPRFSYPGSRPVKCP